MWEAALVLLCGAVKKKSDSNLLLLNESVQKKQINPKGLHPNHAHAIVSSVGDLTCVATVF